MSVLSSILISGHELHRLLDRWGYVVVFAAAGLQSLGLPLPGTTALIAAALYAGNTHRLQIAGIIAAAAVGAMAGAVAAFVLGRRGGSLVLERHGRRVGLTPERLRIARHLFERHGGKIVVAGRFITGMRNAVAFLAGVNRMATPRFLFASAAGALAWAMFNGLGYYLFGRTLRRAGAPLGVAVAVGVVIVLVLAGQFVRRRARTIASEIAGAEAAQAEGARAEGPGAEAARAAGGQPDGGGINRSP